ncbi:hypothetical protein TcCL_NonESM12038 [Trypanosoma cruzi]|nr:hypothetical protein TcCL_NonESM12038 [Trypanosoma cruzi]
MAGGCNAATWVRLGCFVCFSLHRDCSVMWPLGNRSGGNGHASFRRDPTTLHGGCAGLRGRWEGDGVTAWLRLCFFVSVAALWWGFSVAGCFCVPLCLVTVVSVFFFSDRADGGSLV